VDCLKCQFHAETCSESGTCTCMANYAQENVALDHAMNQRLMTESAVPHYEHAAFGYGGNGNLRAQTQSVQSKKVKKGKKTRKKMLSERGAARNDTFSSHMYKMKSKSKK